VDRAGNFRIDIFDAGVLLAPIENNDKEIFLDDDSGSLLSGAG
jgi:hypothetical protein